MKSGVLMPAATRVSLEEYLQSHYEPECELIEGELRQKPMPVLEHTRVGRELLFALRKYQNLGEAFQELSLRISDDTVLIPDVAFVRHPVPASGILETPPLLCVEILSPSDRFSATLAKMERYRAFGVEACWILDPDKKVAWSVGADGRPTEEHHALHAAEIEVPVSDLFAR